jgi:zinc and cadmium transporter
MAPLGWILAGGILMMAIALVGSVTLILEERTLRRIILPLVAFSAGSLLGGAFLHMIPAAIDQAGSGPGVFLWVLAGFTLFLAIEQYLHWHHCHRERADCKEPLSYLILIGDGLHNFMGGVAVAGAFILDIRIGMAAWIAAAAHEVPQELGDFGVLLHAGWSRTQALVLNVLSGMTFLVGGVVAYLVSAKVDVAFLLPFAAGNFIYIGASDLIPEVNKQRRMRENVIHFLSFAAGVGLLLLVKVAVTEH